MPKPVWTDAQIIQQMDSGFHWSGNNLTYGFPTTASWFPYGERAGFSPLSPTQQATATLAIKLWDDLIVPHVSLVADGATANIKFPIRPPISDMRRPIFRAAARQADRSGSIRPMTQARVPTISSPRRPV